MDKRFAYTDIGDFGSNDCVVRAFMQALGMSFEELCKDFHLKSKDGRLKDGFEGLTWMDVPRKYLCRSIALYKWSNWDDNLTVDEFCDITKELYPGVDFVLGCTGRLRGKKVDHATFVRDGKFHDLHEEVGRWRCYSFFAFRNGKSIHLKEDPDPTFDESGKYIHNTHLENNNMKKTITFNQLKRLVKESSGGGKARIERLCTALEKQYDTLTYDEIESKLKSAGFVLDEYGDGQHGPAYATFVHDCGIVVNIEYKFVRTRSGKDSWHAGDVTRFDWHDEPDYQRWSTESTKKFGKKFKKVKESEEDNVIPFEDLEIGDIVHRDWDYTQLSVVIEKGIASEIDDSVGSMAEGIKDGSIDPNTPTVLVQDLDRQGGCTAWVYGDGGVIAEKGMGNINNVQ